VILRGAFLIVLATLALAYSPALAAEQSGVRFEVAHYIDVDGRGIVIATRDPAGTSFSWESCFEGVCSPTASDPHSGNWLRVGDAPVGTVFVATGVNGSETGSANSVPYRGRMQPTGAPAIDGVLRVGERVRPVAGTWTGGWGRETDYLQMQVCRSADGLACSVVVDTSWYQSSANGAVLAPDDCGRYVRVLNTRQTTDLPVPAIGPPPIDRLRPQEPGPIASAFVAGPVACDVSTRPSPKTSPVPRIELVSEAVRRRGRLLLGRVTCPNPCHVNIRVRQGARRVRFARTFPAAPVPRKLSLPARLARRLKAGPARVRVSLGRRTTSTRRVLLPPR
jgi:hypothetical protein